jgi:hypothetical protein
MAVINLLFITRQERRFPRPVKAKLDDVELQRSTGNPGQ